MAARRGVGGGTRAAEGLKRTIIAQGRKSDSLGDQLGQKLPGDGSVFDGSHRPALIGGCRRPARHWLPSQNNTFLLITAAHLPLKPPQEQIPCLGFLKMPLIFFLESLTANFDDVM